MILHVNSLGTSCYCCIATRLRYQNMTRLAKELKHKRQEPGVELWTCFLLYEYPRKLGWSMIC